MDIEKIRELSDGDLVQHANQAGEQLFRIRFQKSMGNLEGVKALRVHKRDIARVKTVQRERALAAGHSQADASPSAADPAPAPRSKGKKANA